MPLVKAQGALLLMIAAADAFKAANGVGGPPTDKHTCAQTATVVD